MGFLKKYNDIIISIIIVFSLIIFGKIVSTYIISYREIEDLLLKYEFKVYSLLILNLFITIMIFFIGKKYLLNNSPIKYSNLKYAILPLIFTLSPLLNNITIIEEYSLSFQLIALFFISNLLVAILEEFLFRKLILNILLSKRSLILSLVISSLMFSLVHIINIQQIEYDVFSIINQIILAFGLGFLLATLYYSTKTILVPIIIHTFINFNFSFGQIYKTYNEIGIEIQSVNLFEEIISTSFFILISSILLIYSFYILKGKTI